MQASVEILQKVDYCFANIFPFIKDLTPDEIRSVAPVLIEMPYKFLQLIEKLVLPKIIYSIYPLLQMPNFQVSDDFVAFLNEHNVEQIQEMMPLFRSLEQFNGLFAQTNLLKLLGKGIKLDVISVIFPLLLQQNCFVTDTLLTALNDCTVEQIHEIMPLLEGRSVYSFDNLISVYKLYTPEQKAILLAGIRHGIVLGQFTEHQRILLSEYSARRTEKMTDLDIFMSVLSNVRFELLECLVMHMDEVSVENRLSYIQSLQTLGNQNHFIALLQHKEDPMTISDVLQATYRGLSVEQMPKFAEFLRNRTPEMDVSSVLLAITHNLQFERLVALLPHVLPETVDDYERSCENMMLMHVCSKLTSEQFSALIGLLGQQSKNRVDVAFAVKYNLPMERLEALLPHLENYPQSVRIGLIKLYGIKEFAVDKIESDEFFFEYLGVLKHLDEGLFKAKILEQVETSSPHVRRLLDMLDSMDPEIYERACNFILSCVLQEDGMGFMSSQATLPLENALVQKALIRLPHLLELKSGNKEFLKRICDILLGSDDFNVNFVSFGFDDESELIQTAMFHRAELSKDITDPTNNWKVWGDMLKKRKVDLNLSTLVPPPQDFNGKSVRLNAPAIAEFAKDVRIVESTVPSIAPTALNDMLGTIEGRLNNGLREKIIEVTAESFDNIRARALGHVYSFLTNLLSSPKIGLINAQFRCIMAYTMSLSNSDGAADKLSTQEEYLLKTLSGIQGCPTGQGGGVEAAYLGIPPTFKFETVRGGAFSGVNMLEDQRKGKTLLMDIMKEAADTYLTNSNLLMHDFTKVPEGEEIPELVHQGKYMVCFIGDEVAINHPLTFNHHAGYLKPNLLTLSKEEALTKFYAYAMADNKLILFVKQKIQEMVDHKVGFIGFDSLRGNLTTFEMWGVDPDDFPAPPEKITDAGVLQLLLSVGVLQDVGSMAASSSQ